MSLKIVIVGAGEVGYNLSKYLANEDYAITVIDIDEQKCLKIKNAIDAKFGPQESNSENKFKN